MASETVKIAKKSLQRNYSRIIKELANPDDVAEHLFSAVDPPLLTDTMKEEIVVTKKPTEKTRTLLRFLEKRGERVPQKLYEAFMETGNEELAQCMVEYIGMQNDEKQKTAPSTWPPDESELTQMLQRDIHKLKPNDPIIQRYFNNTDANNIKQNMYTYALCRVELVKKFPARVLTVYKMHGKRRGVCLLINIVEYQNNPEQKPFLDTREGSDQDAENLSNVFKQLHFDVQQKKNLTSEQILSETEKFAKTIPETDSCVVVAIFSHGGKDGIYGHDNVPVRLEAIKEKFHPVVCPALNEKPKIFFIQACRGRNKEKAIKSKEEKKGDQHVTDFAVDQIADDISDMTVSDASTENNANIQGTLTVSKDSDFLIAYSTPEGAQSWRHKLYGSWFILAIVWVFRCHAHELSLTDMLQRVNKYVSQGRTNANAVTVSNFTSSLRHPVYFFPGIYDFHGYPREHPGTLE